MDVSCGTACTVTVQIEPARMSTEDMTDYLEAFGLMFLALLAIWGGKQLYKVFDGGPHDGS